MALVADAKTVLQQHTSVVQLDPTCVVLPEPLL